MKKILLLATLLIVMGASVFADTSTVRPMLSVVGNTTGFQPFTKLKYWMVDGTVDYLYIMVRLGGADGSAQKLAILKSSDDGATWSVDSTSFGTSATNVARMNAYGRVDTLYALHNANTGDYPRLDRHRGGTAFSASADTAQLQMWDSATTSGYTNGGIVWVGDTLVFAEVINNTSIVVGKSGSAYGTSMTWVAVDSVSHSTAGDGWIIPVEALGGCLIIGTGGAQLFADKWGIDTLSATMTSPGGGTAAYRTMFAVDSSSANGTLPDTAIIHKITQDGDEIEYERYTLINTSDSNDVMTRTHQTILATTAEMPTPSTSGTEAYISFGYPFIQVVRGTDKVIAGHVFWPNVAQTDSTKLVYYLSNDNGQNFGTRTDFRQLEDRDFRILIAPMYVDEISNVVYGNVAWADSIAAADTHIDTVRVFNWTIGSVNDPIHSLTQVKVGHNRVQLKDSVIPVNGTVDSLKLFIKTTNPPTDVWRALDTSATTRIVKTYALDSTALTRNTKFYYRWAIKDDVGWDTSAVDSFTTKDSLDPTVGTVAAQLKATTADIRMTVTNTKVESYNGNLHSSVLIWDLSNPPGSRDSILNATYPNDTISMTGLEKNTKYYIRAMVRDSGDTALGVLDSFTTDPGIDQGYYVADTNTNSFVIHDTLKEYVDTIARITLYVNTVAANVLTTPVDSTLDPAGVVDTLTAANLTSGQKYYFRLIAQDAQVSDTTALDSITTLAIAVDLGEITTLLQQIITMNDTLLDGFLRGSHGILSNIGGAVYGYLTSPAGDRLIRISDSTNLARWLWEHNVSVYDAAAETLMAGYSQNRANMFDYTVDTLQFVRYLLNNLDTLNYLLASAGYDSITIPIIAEIESHQATSGGSSGGASQSLGTNILPYSVLGKDTTTIPLATAYTNVHGYSGTYLGWWVSSTKNGSTIPVVSIDSINDDDFPIEDLMTNVSFAGTHSAGVYDSVRFRSGLFKLYPGFYKYGLRIRRGLVHTIDTMEIELRNSAGTILDSFFLSSGIGLVDSVFTDLSDDYYSTTATDAYMVMRFVDNHSSGTPYIDWTYAFVNLLGYNTWAVDSAVAGLGTSNMGRVAIIGGTSTEASVWTAANRDTLLNRSSLIPLVRDTVNAFLDTLQDGANGMLVNVQAFNGDSSAANALGYILDTSSTGKGKMTVQNIAIGPAADGLTNPLAITAGASSVPAVQISQGTGSSAGLNISGGGPAVSLAGGATASSGLVVAGSGGAADVTGTFVDSGSITLGDISITLAGSGDNNVVIVVTDTSGTDEKVMDVNITVRVLGASSPEAYLTTNDSGRANFTLPAGTFEVLTRKGGYQFPTDTITVTGDATVNIYGYNTASVNQCAVWGYVGGVNSGLISNAQVTFSLANKVNDTCADIILTNWTTSTRTDQNGRFETNLTRSSCLSNEQYNVVIRYKDGSTRNYTFTVPDQTTYQLIWN